MGSNEASSQLDSGGAEMYRGGHPGDHPEAPKSTSPQVATESDARNYGAAGATDWLEVTQGLVVGVKKSGDEHWELLCALLRARLRAGVVFMQEPEFLSLPELDSVSEGGKLAMFAKLRRLADAVCCAAAGGHGTGEHGATIGGAGGKAVARAREGTGRDRAVAHPPCSALPDGEVCAAAAAAADEATVPLLTKYSPTSKNATFSTTTKWTQKSSADASDERPKDASADDEGSADATSTVLNIVKNVVGAGLLSLPKSFYEGGPLGASVWILFMGFVFGLSFWLLGVVSGAAKSRGRKCNSYGDIWSATVGGFTWVADLCLLINGAVTACSYTVIAGTLLPPGLPSVFGLLPEAYSLRLGPTCEVIIPQLKRAFAVLPVCALVIYPVVFFAGHTTNDARAVSE